MKRVAAGSLVAALLLTATVAQAETKVSVIAPASATPVPDQVAVVASVTSEYAITSVTAQIGTVTLPLPSLQGAWKGTLDITALPLGPTTLTVTAHDASGASTTYTSNLVHDHPPILSVQTPTWSVARPSLPLQATCTGNATYACTSITVKAKNVVVASSGTTMNQSASLSAYDGSDIELVFTATDAAGMSTTVTRPVVVESSPHLALVTAIRRRPEAPIPDAGADAAADAGANAADAGTGPSASSSGGSAGPSGANAGDAGGVADGGGDGDSGGGCAIASHDARASFPIGLVIAALPFYARRRRVDRSSVS